ncbi:hypothetical protein [Aquimarina algicola]|uniref:Uncharacterized protein n=1 Tax=Aquimarina algicola TaxID=2589995 RepID=A0A504J0P9_9FLAO|nr:hypothetical protein [Aquimarina algicola]TPN84387.1 hypothetical protein FHK87_15735 [Aquimarina algicola]
MEITIYIAIACGLIFLAYLKISNIVRNSSHIDHDKTYAETKTYVNLKAIKKFVDQADRVKIDLNAIEFKHKVTTKTVNTNDKFISLDNRIDYLPDTYEQKRYINHGVITFNYKNQEHKQLVVMNGIDEKSLLIYLYMQKHTYLYIDKHDISIRFLDLFFLHEASEGKFQPKGIEQIDLANNDTMIKNSMYTQY